MHEILFQQEIIPDIVIIPVGRGGLLSGCIKYAQNYNNENNGKNIKIMGAELSECDSLNIAIKNGSHIKLNRFVTFVDGTNVPEDGIIIESAGAL